MSQSTQGCEVTTALSHLAPVFETWLRFFTASSEAFPQLGSSWYNEPGLVSLLGAAAWNVGLPAVAEWRTTKNDAPSEVQWSGHADLVVKHDDSRTAFEAKLTWLGVTSRCQQLLDYLDSACCDARYLPDQLGLSRIGIVFGLYWLPGRATINTEFQSILSDLQKAQPDILVWSLAPMTRAELQCPGGYLVGRRVAPEPVAK